MAIRRCLSFSSLVTFHLLTFSLGFSFVWLCSYVRDNEISASYSRTAAEFPRVLISILRTYLSIYYGMKKGQICSTKDFLCQVCRCIMFMADATKDGKKLEGI